MKEIIWASLDAMAVEYPSRLVERIREGDHASELGSLQLSGSRRKSALEECQWNK